MAAVSESTALGLQILSMHDPQKRSRYNNCSLCRGSLKKWLPIILPFGQTTPLIKRECLYLSSWIWDDFVVLFFTETHSRISERSFMGYQKPLFCCLGAQPSYCKDVWAPHRRPAGCHMEPGPSGDGHHRSPKHSSSMPVLISFLTKVFYGDKDLCPKHSLSFSADMQLSITL